MININDYFELDNPSDVFEQSSDNTSSQCETDDLSDAVADQFKVQTKTVKTGLNSPLEINE